MRRPVLAGWGLAVLALVPFVALTGPARAEAATAVGYWTGAQVTVDPLGTVVPTGPPNVPPGGFYVAYDGSEAQGVATIRYPFTEPTGGTLTLRFAPGSTTPTAMINVCAVASPWEPTVNGDLATAPTPACDQFQNNGSISDDGTSVSFVIPENAPVRGGALEFYILPAEVVSAFSLAFEAPGEDSFEPSGGGDFPDFGFGGDSGGGDFSGGGGDFSSGGDASGGTAGGTGSTDSFGGATAPSSAGTGFSAPGASGSFTTPTPVPAVTPGTTGTASGGTGTGSGGSDQLTGNQAPPGPLDDGRARTAAIVALLVIGGGLFWLSTRNPGAPLALGALAGGGAAPVVAGAADPVSRRGVGRFARPRIRPPVPL
jgi:hypothetical protein